MNKIFFILALSMSVSVQVEAKDNLFCLGLVKAAKEASFIGVVETESIARDDDADKYRYSAYVTAKIKSESEGEGDDFRWSDSQVYDIDKRKLLFVFEDGLVAFELEYFLDAGYVLVPRGGIEYFMISPETSYPSFPVYQPALKNKEGEIINEVSGHLIPLDIVVKNISAAVSFDMNRCRNK